MRANSCKVKKFLQKAHYAARDNGEMASQPRLEMALKFMDVFIFNAIWITKSPLGHGILFLIN